MTVFSVTASGGAVAGSSADGFIASLSDTMPIYEKFRQEIYGLPNLGLRRIEYIYRPISIGEPYVDALRKIFR